MEIGTVATLKLPCLGNPAGARGVCYEVYRIGHRPGWSFVFKNGNYDGFSPCEVVQFLRVVGHSGLRYSFRDVGRLAADFRDGHFAPVLGPWPVLP